jgi:hypothetical protein
MDTTTEPRSKKIRRRVACTIVATTLAVVVGVSTAPAASASTCYSPITPTRLADTRVPL